MLRGTTPTQKPTQPGKALGSTDSGRFAPQLPTEGRELLAAWELPASAWDSESVKVARCIIGTSRVEVLDSMPMRDWTLNRTAREYGPGKYRMSPGPGPYSAKSCTVEVSEEFARREGWASAPPVHQSSASEAMAVRTYQKAQEGPVDRLELAQMIEAAIMRAQPPRPAADPLEMLMKGVEFANTMNQRAVDMMKGTIGGNMIEKAPTTIGDAIIELAPTILDAIKTLAPAILSAVNRPAILAPPAVPTPTHGAPLSEPLSPSREPVTLPILTAAEVEAASPIVAVMKPYAGMLAAQLKAHPPEDLAGQLAGMIGPDLYESTLALCDITRKYGLSTLAHIGPGLSTPAAGIVIETLAQHIRETMAENDSE